MKAAICTQIQEMSLNEFYEFISNTEIAEEGLSDDKIYLQLSNVLTCRKCKELYGCPYSGQDIDETVCFERFKHYCKQEFLNCTEQ